MIGVKSRVDANGLKTWEGQLFSWNIILVFIFWMSFVVHFASSLTLYSPLTVTTNEWTLPLILFSCCLTALFRIIMILRFNLDHYEKRKIYLEGCKI